ncbi:hypothetical protein Plec18167_006757 [Paecilomyces lecythidis]|uniref:Cytochrome P450 n=1 Tax=Paecilomyces lecythidis TaxID=3004212 RepID=A0ABR3X884_9EURO
MACVRNCDLFHQLREPYGDVVRTGPCEETLHLNPAVPSASLHTTPKGGLTLNGIYIPKGTTVVTPQYSLMGDERNFIHPNNWIPERFTTHPELVLDKQGFVAWATRKYSCVGKISLLEIRTAAAQIVKTFDIEFAPGEDGTTMFREALDFFTTTPGPLYLVLKEWKN